jgi:hypothetical protein
MGWTVSKHFGRKLVDEVSDGFDIKDEAYLFYKRTQCVPRCKHSTLRL